MKRLRAHLSCLDLLKSIDVLPLDRRQWALTGGVVQYQKLVALCLVTVLSVGEVSAQPSTEDTNRVANEAVERVMKEYEKSLLEHDESTRQSYYKQAQGNWLSCLRRSVAALDDGISTVSDVADVVKTDCQKEADRMFAFSRGGYSPNRTGIQEVNKATASRLIQQQRATAKKK